MITAFKVVVEYNGKWLSKEIIEQKVHTITEKYVTFDEMGTKIKVSREHVFLDRESAERECESRGNELIAKLQTLIRELKEPCKFTESAGLRYAKQIEENS